MWHNDHAAFKFFDTFSKRIDRFHISKWLIVSSNKQTKKQSEDKFLEHKLKKKGGMHRGGGYEGAQR